jgi:hypothetical protein
VAVAPTRKGAPDPARRFEPFAAGVAWARVPARRHLRCRARALVEPAGRTTTRGSPRAPRTPPAAALSSAPHRVSLTSRPKQWPSYERCLRDAPLLHNGDRPDVSRADFTFCLLAIDWGWTVPQVCRRLLQMSSKARHSGEAYASSLRNGLPTPLLDAGLCAVSRQPRKFLENSRFPLDGTTQMSNGERQLSISR